MGTLRDLKKRVQNLKGKEVSLASEALQDNSEIAADLVAGQLAQGVKSDGTKSDFTYAPFTIAVKRGKPGLAGITDHLTNFDTGESYRGLYMKVNGDKIEFGTKSNKEESISDRMDGEAFRPDQDNKEELVRNHAQPAFMKKVKDILKL